jgi:hypothetical protein
MPTVHQSPSPGLLTPPTHPPTCTHKHMRITCMCRGYGLSTSLLLIPSPHPAAHGQVLHRILTNASWQNCHTLPHSEFVFEMRVPEGFGCRWTLDASLFRGFLEPHMADGHEKGWRH